MTQPQSIGRPYSPTDLGHALMARVGSVVAYVDDNGDTQHAELTRVHGDGTVTLATDDIVVAVVPADRVLPDPDVPDDLSPVDLARRQAQYVLSTAARNAEADGEAGAAMEMRRAAELLGMAPARWLR